MMGVAKMICRSCPGDFGQFQTNYILEKNNKGDEKRDNGDTAQADSLAKRTVGRIVRIVLLAGNLCGVGANLQQFSGDHARTDGLAVNMRLRNVRYPKEGKENQRGSDAPPKGRITPPRRCAKWKLSRPHEIRPLFPAHRSKVSAGRQITLRNGAPLPFRDIVMNCFRPRAGAIFGINGMS